MKVRREALPVPGFRAAGLHAGIKARDPDLAAREAAEESSRRRELLVGTRAEPDERRAIQRAVGAGQREDARALHLVERRPIGEEALEPLPLRLKRRALLVRVFDDHPLLPLFSTKISASPRQQSLRRPAIWLTRASNSGPRFLTKIGVRVA